MSGETASTLRGQYRRHLQERSPVSDHSRLGDDDKVLSFRGSVPFTNVRVEVYEANEQDVEVPRGNIDVSLVFLITKAGRGLTSR